MRKAVKKTILIIEDEVSQRKALSEKLEREGFAILQAGNGEEGLRISLEKHPDIILLDIVMPKMDGMSMMKKLREENDWGKKVPIIILTNIIAADDKMITRLAEDEPSYYLIKSDWTIDEVTKKIQERLTRK